MRSGIRHLLFPVEIASWFHRRSRRFALKDHAMIRLVARQIDGTIEKRFVLDNTVDLDAA